MKLQLALLPVVAASALLIPDAKAQHCQNGLVGQAHTIIGIANDLQTEFRLHYAHSGAYRHLMADVQQVLAEARHIDSLAHNPYSSYRHIQADLRDLDRLAHHLHDVVDDVERGKYYGHIDGNTRHVHVKLSALNSAIHSMQRTVAVYANPPVHHHHDYHRSHHPSPYDVFGTIMRGMIRSGGHHHH